MNQTVRPKLWGGSSASVGVLASAETDRSSVSNGLSGAGWAKTAPCAQARARQVFCA